MRGFMGTAHVKVSVSTVNRSNKYQIVADIKDHSLQ